MLHHMKGHSDTVTGLALSPDGSYVLSNSMDNSLRVWDIRPFAPQERCIKMMVGHSHNFEKVTFEYCPFHCRPFRGSIFVAFIRQNLLRCSWSPDGTKVSAGSADRFVYVWDTTSRRIIYKLPGHNGSVNEVVFHPKEPISKSLIPKHFCHVNLDDSIPTLFILKQLARVAAINRFTSAKSNREEPPTMFDSPL